MLTPFQYSYKLIPSVYQPRNHYVDRIHKVEQELLAKFQIIPDVLLEYFAGGLGAGEYLGAGSGLSIKDGPVQDESEDFVLEVSIADPRLGGSINIRMGTKTVGIIPFRSSVGPSSPSSWIEWMPS